MVELFDFFPFDMDPGAGFTGVFLLFSVGLMVLGIVVRNAVARRIDLGPRSTLAAPSTPTGGDPAPTQGGPNPALAVGVLPRGEQLWMVAWMRAGKVGVVQALLARAWAEGWLSSSPDNRLLLRFTGREAPRDRVAAMFYAQLERTQGKDLNPEDVHSSATHVAKWMEPKLWHEVKAAGMERRSSGQWRVALVMLLFGALAEALAVIRVVVCETLRPDAPFPESSLLGTIAMLVVAPVFILLAIFGPSSSASKRYLEWLQGATKSLVGDVEAGRRKQPADVTLAAAVAGLGVVNVPSELGLVAAAHEVERVQSYEPPSLNSYTSMGP